MNMLLLRRAGGVKRYHVRPIIGEDTVGNHTWGALVLLYKLVENPSPEMVRYMVFHDVAEVLTGDIPADAKWRWQNLTNALCVAEAAANHELGVVLPELTEAELRMCKAADMLDLLWFCFEQRRFGNQGLDEVWQNGLEYLETMCRKAPVATIKIWEALQEVVSERERLFPNEPSSI